MVTKNQVDEKFDADHSEAELPDPVNTGSTKRPADNTQGEKAPKMTKNKLVADIIAKASRMDKGVLSDAHGRFTSVFDGGAKDTSKSNMATITTKEDIDEIFGETELTEDFRVKAHTLFETAVQARVIVETARIEEEFEAQLDEQVEARMAEINEAVDAYLSHVAEQWLEDNELAVEAGIRSEISESFLEGLHQLFAEHYVSVPEEGTDIVAELTNQVAELKEQVNEETEARIKVSKQLQKIRIDDLKEQAMEGLVDTDKEKFEALAEAISYDDEEEFAQKLAIIKENYFSGNKKPKTPVKDQLISEEIEDADDNSETKEVYADPQMATYVQQLSRTLKR